MSKKIAFAIFAFFVFAFVYSNSQTKRTYYTNKGKIIFISDNSLEVIRAQSDELKGIVGEDNHSFAFAVRVMSFEGFKVALQREHFNENYLESGLYPNATFQGKIIDDFDFNKEGTSTVRAKGILKIHGVEQEKIIKVQLIKKGDVITAHCFFSILLNDYDIKIPRIVHDKISPEIRIEVKADLLKK